MQAGFDHKLFAGDCLVDGGDKTARRNAKEFNSNTDKQQSVYLSVVPNFTEKGIDILLLVLPMGIMKIRSPIPQALHFSIPCAIAAMSTTTKPDCIISKAATMTL